MKDVGVQTERSVDHEILHLKETIRTLKRNYKNLQKKFKKEHQKNLELQKKVESILNNDQFQALMNKHRRFKKCSEETVIKGLKIKLSCGRRAYEAIRHDLNIPLPSISTLNSRLQNLQFESGIMHEIFEFLKIKTSTMCDFEKDCMLTLDEMALRPSVDYCNSTHSYVGNVTLPGHEGIANHALVFMLGGINTRWKQTIAYYFTGDSVDGSVIAEIIIEIIKQSAAINLRIHSVTSDMGASNQGMWRSFGIVAGRNSKTNNYIKHPTDSNSLVYFLADVPHLYKNIKQCLIKNKVIEIPASIMVKYNLPNKIVNVEHITNFCEEQDAMELKFAPKLNKEHLDPNHFDKMKVSNAYRVLNHDVSSGLKFIAEEMNDNSTSTTAWFIDFIFKWFKILSSRNSTLALSKFDINKYQETQNFLADIIELFTYMKICPDARGVATWKPIQTGVILSTTSIINLQDIFLNKKNYKFLLTSRFSQDCLENVFSILRSKQALPSPLQFKQNLKNICVAQYLKSKNRNSSYENDDYEELGGFLKYVQTEGNTKKKDAADNILILPSGWNDLKRELTNREKNILYNCGGYILRSISRQHKCKRCLLSVGSQKKEIRDYSRFVNLKEYSENSLFYLNKKSFKLIIVMEQTFTNLKSKYCLYDADKKDLFKTLKQSIEREPAYNLTKFTDCHNIKNKLVDRFIKYRLRLHAVKMKYRINRNSTICSGSKSLGMRDMASLYRPGYKTYSRNSNS